jgi:hypothetical protein
MKKIEIKIRQKEKGLRELSLLNLRDEVVDFLYKETIANSTKVDLQFFVILYFALIRIGNETLLEKILNEGIPKFTNLNNAFANETGYLRAHQYRKMIEEYGLIELFENDIFFLLIESMMQIEEMQARFETFLKEHAEIEVVLNKVAVNYAPKIVASFEIFQSKRIKDDRYDEYGRYYDLSKSVYRTVRMRNARNLDLNLQKYTSIREITSKSPIDLTFFQQVDPQIIFSLWDKFHVADYMKTAWNFANDYPLVSGAASMALYDLVKKFGQWKRIDGKKNHAAKNKARREFDKSKSRNGKTLDDLTLRLVNSVLRANERLEKEIERSKVQLGELSDSSISSHNKAKIKKLESRIAQLENLVVSSKLIED